MNHLLSRDRCAKTSVHRGDPRPAGLLVASAFLALGGCTGTPTPFVEVQSASGTWMFVTPATDGSAHGQSEWGATVTGPLTGIRHNLSSRYAVFAFLGDITQQPVTIGDLPADGHTVFFPSVTDTAGVTFALPSVGSKTWQSFRTYDRGECSLSLGYAEIASSISSQMLEVVTDVDDVTIDNARWTTAEVVLGVQATPDQSVAATPHDIVDFALNFEADFIGNVAHVVGCNDVRGTARIKFELERIQAHTQAVNLKALVAARVLNTNVPNDFDLYKCPRYCTPLGGTRPGYCPPVPYQATCDLFDPAQPNLENAYSALLETFTNGTVSSQLFLDATSSGASVNSFPIAAADDILFLDDFSGVARNQSHRALLVYSTWGTWNFNATDYIARIKSVAVEGLSTRRCIDAAENTIRGVIVSNARSAVPLAIRDALRTQLSLDAAFFGFGYSQPGSTAIVCETDADCNFMWETGGYYGPAFMSASGQPRGLRHSCEQFSSTRYASLGPAAATLLADGNPELKYCHVQLEPERINLRPDRIEVVLADSRTTDSQSDFYGGIVGSQVCGTGASRRATDPPTTSPLLTFDPGTPFTATAP